MERIHSRTLPLRVTPTPGETVDSWLEAIARRYPVRFGDLTAAIGIRTVSTVGSGWLRIDNVDIVKIAAATSVPVEHIRSMTMRRYCNPQDCDTDAARLKRALWIRHIGSRFCPECLRDNDGRWMIAWRLNWSSVCLQHECLLQQHCPRCQSDQRRRSPRVSEVPKRGILCRGPGLCTNSLVDCVTAPIPPGHPVLAAQRAIADLLEHARGSVVAYGGQIVTGLEAISDVKWITQWMCGTVDHPQLRRLLPADLACVMTRHREESQWPHGLYWTSATVHPTALETLAGVAASMEIVGASDESEVLELLDQLIRSTRRSQTLSQYRVGMSPSLRRLFEAAYEPVRADRKRRGVFERAAARSAHRRSAGEASQAQNLHR